jgi:hypothetical protein
MARLTLTTGACPVCDLDVARTVSTVLGMKTETYHCRSHGSISYDPHRLMGTCLGQPSQVMDVGFAQPLTGIELVQ